MRTTRGDGGSATILIMLIAAVIVTVGLGFNWLVREHIRASEGLKNKVEAILKARSAFDTVTYLILNGQFSRKEVIVVGGTDITELKTLPLNGQAIPLSEDVQVQIQDSNGMISLGSLRTGPLERLIKKTANLESAVGPLNCFLDWIDTDDLTRIDGAESSYYRGQGLPYVPRNYALQYKEEVGFIKGFENGLYGSIEPYVTMLHSTGFNPNTASDTVLMAYLDINEGTLQRLKEFMSPGAIFSNRELFALTGRLLAGEDDFHLSPLMEVTVKAGAPKPIYNIRAGINITQNPYSPYSVIYWSEE